MEGFGLPAIEAAACGCPVVATSESAIPDVLGAAGKYFDPHNPAQLEQVLREVLSSDALRQQMSEAGLKITSDITWETAAYQMLEVFEKISPM
jgi:glycosyltransferase involved in cell wall biosynthesis